VAVDQLGPRNLRQLLDAVLAIGSELDLDRALRHIVETATSLVDATYGALGVLDEDRSGLAAFITVGVDDDVHRAIGELPRGRGLLGTLIVDARPMRVPDIAEHADRFGFPPNHPPMTSFLGVPIVSRGEVFGNLYLTDKRSGEVFTDLDEQLVTGLAAAAGIVIDNARLYGRVERRDAALTAINDVLATVADRGDGQSALELVADRACTLVAADIATVALPVPGTAELVLDVVAGAATNELRGRRFPIASSVSGEVMHSGRPIVLADAASDLRVDQPQVGAGSIGPAVWVPLTVDGHPIGTLSIARFSGGAPFSAAELELVLLFAAQASVILEVDRARDDARRISVLQDQERIARDLHDTVIQRLFATGLSLQASIRMADGALTARLETAVEDLDATIRQIRTVIFGLERPVTGRTGVRSRVLDLCTESARALGFDPTVTFDGAVDTGLDDRLADEVLAVLREALSNVSRHAAASSVQIAVAIADHAVVVTVADDGKGMAVLSDARLGNGIDNMRARAARRGGGFTIGPGPAAGTLVRWSVPLPER
jgi:signal transduction histidine kinase